MLFQLTIHASRVNNFFESGRKMVEVSQEVPGTNKSDIGELKQDRTETL